jgi:hypothetical protein
MPVTSKTKKAPAKSTAPKHALSTVLEMSEWDIEESFCNDDETFAIYRFSRKGWLTYDIVAFSDVIKMFRNELNPHGDLEVSITWTKPPNSQNWTYRLVGRLSS